MLLMDEVHQTADQILDGFCENHTDLLPAVERKRLTNTPVRGQLKWPDEWRTESFCTQATYARRSSALCGGVCEQRYTADRVLSESGSELCRIGLGSWLEVAAAKLIVATVGVATVTVCLDEARSVETWLVRHSVFANGES